MRDWTQQKDTKLPTYPRKGSSHQVVEKFFFFFITFFSSFSYVFLQKKEGSMCNSGYHY